MLRMFRRTCGEEVKQFWFILHIYMNFDGWKGGQVVFQSTQRMVEDIPIW